MQLDLTASMLVARGKNRDVYTHPNDETLLVKVINAGRQRREESRSAWGRLTKPSYTREFMLEIAEVYRALRRQGGLRDRLPIIEVAGLVSTSLGMGLAVERINDAHGALAPTLAQLVEDGQFDEALLAKLNVFVDRVFRLAIVAEDLDPKNIVWDQASESFVLVDGFGEKPVIPIHVWSKTVNALHLTRCFEQRLGARAGLTWDKRARAFVA